MSADPGQWMVHAARRHAARTALISADAASSVAAEVRYADLPPSLDRLAHRLRRLGWDPKLGLAVFDRRADRLALGLLLALRTGAAYLPLDPRRHTAELVTRAGLGCVFSELPIAPPSALLRLPLDLLAPGSFEAARPQAPPPAVQPATDRVLIATSGSTGEPKLVRLSTANLTAAVLASRQRIPLAPDDLWLACLPLFHVGGLMIPLRCLQAGATALLHTGFDTARVHADLHRRRVSHISLVPAMLAALLDLDPRPPPGLRHALIGGASLSTALGRRALRHGWPIHPSYGLSETSSQAATLINPPADWCEGSVGTPLPGVRIQVLDADGNPCQGPGRISIAGPTVMQGYVGQPAQSGPQGSFLTRDLGRLDGQGRLQVLGRADQVLVSGGENIHPHEVERRLEGCPLLREVAVTTRPDPVWGDLLVALVVPSDGADYPLEPRLEDWCRRHLPGPLRPRAFVPVTALPRTPAGKIERPMLRRLASADRTLPHVAPDCECQQGRCRPGPSTLDRTKAPL